MLIIHNSLKLLEKLSEIEKIIKELEQRETKKKSLNQHK